MAPKWAPKLDTWLKLDTFFIRFCFRQSPPPHSSLFSLSLSLSLVLPSVQVVCISPWQRCWHNHSSAPVTALLARHLLLNSQFCREGPENSIVISMVSQWWELVIPHSTHTHAVSTTRGQSQKQLTHAYSKGVCVDVHHHCVLHYAGRFCHIWLLSMYISTP